MDFFPFDDDYVRRLREGDRDTEAHFTAYFRDLLLLQLRNRLASMQAIDDVRQEVFARVLSKLHELEDGRKLGAYVSSVCNLVLMEWYRKNSRSSAELPAVTADPAKDAETVLVSEEQDARVRRVLGRIPGRDAELLRAVFFDESAKEEVCRRFGVRRSYLRVLLHRAKERFRSEFRRRSSALRISVRLLSRTLRN
ncbi:MAG TPA: sigma-70 family RNA polymerase sigma factor [Thermoanaerobaculia bacterium]|nr:sigma-70 family RNA polymerase sigma factor [Thermoanaerobaculia bacterium]